MKRKAMDTFDWVSVGRATTSSRDVSSIVEFAKKHLATLQDMSEKQMAKHHLNAFRTLFDACLANIDAQGVVP